MESQDALREVIREVVREVIREVVAEEMAAVAAASEGRRPGRAVPSAAPRHAGQVDRRAIREDHELHLAHGALTERHLRAAGDTAVVRIGSRVVITPLARDWARSRGIDIVRIDG